MNIEELTFDQHGLIPCIVQDAQDNAVLMMAWMNAESIHRTLDTKTTWFWSRSRQEYWNKGATSGNFQHLVELRYDCDADCLLALVPPDGPACQTGARSGCYRTRGAEESQSFNPCAFGFEPFLRRFSYGFPRLRAYSIARSRVEFGRRLCAAHGPSFAWCVPLPSTPLRVHKIILLLTKL